VRRRVHRYTREWEYARYDEEAYNHKADEVGKPNARSFLGGSGRGGESQGERRERGEHAEIPHNRAVGFVTSSPGRRGSLSPKTRAGWWPPAFLMFAWSRCI